jgi:hypothetical protein
MEPMSFAGVDVAAVEGVIRVGIIPSFDIPSLVSEWTFLVGTQQPT